jgi:hypothetical protein
VIRNVRIVLGDNPGAVGIRHAGAEGSSAQEVTIDVRGGFAGIYNLNSTGGYTYNVEVYGGKYGIYQHSHGGGSTLITGLKLADQTDTPIVAIAKNTLGIVGFEIQHDDGKIISSIKSHDGTPGYLRSSDANNWQVSTNTPILALMKDNIVNRDC